MKFLSFLFLLALTSCTTTTTTAPDGTKITVTTSDPKVIREISGVVNKAADAAIVIESNKATPRP